MKSWIDDNKKYLLGDGDIFILATFVLICSFFILGFVYCYSNLEPQLFFDWYYTKLKVPFFIRDLSFENAYLNSVDPVRNFIFRLFGIDNILRLWFFSSILYFFSGVCLLLVLKKTMKIPQNFTLLYFCFLLLFNLTFFRLIQGSQNVSVLVGVSFFMCWLLLVTYFPAKKWWVSPLAVFSIWSNLLLLPLLIFIVYFYYQKNDLKNMLGSFSIFLAGFGVPLWFKNRLVNQENLFIFGNPIEQVSFFNDSQQILGFIGNLKGVIGAMGKVLLPFGTRQFYFDIIQVDYLGVIMVFIFVITPLVYLYVKKKIQMMKVFGILLLLCISLLWPAFYRQAFPFDKLAGLQLGSSIFFQTVNNDDLIAFYLCSFIPLILFMQKLELVKRRYFLIALLIQSFFIGSYASKLLTVEPYLNTQLKSEPDNPFLNLSYLFYANQNKENFEQLQLQKYWSKLQNSKNEKAKLLGKFFLASILPIHRPQNMVPLELKELEDAHFHPILMTQVYLYFQKFDSLKKAQYGLWSNEHYPSYLRTNSYRMVENIKKGYYWETMYYLGIESSQLQRYHEAQRYMILAGYYMVTQEQMDKTRSLLAYVTRNIQEKSNEKLLEKVLQPDTLTN